MAIKKRVPATPKFKGHISRTSSSKEKLIITLFLIFAILAVIVLFQSSPTTLQQPTTTGTTGMATGASVFSGTLDKNTFNANEKLTGVVGFKIEPADVLPQTMNITLLVSGNISKCAEKYVCPNGQTVPWHTYNASTEECDLVSPDPEGDCCKQNKGCNQLVIDNSFEASGLKGMGQYWPKISSGVNPTIAIGVEEGGYTDEFTYSNFSAFVDSTALTGNPQTTKAGIKQTFPRSANISEFKKPIIRQPIKNASEIQTQSFGSGEITPDLEFAGVPTTLQFALEYSAQGSIGYYFELIVKGTSQDGLTPKNLHYYFPIPGGLPFTPTQSTTDKYIKLDVPGEGELIWVIYSRSIYSDWVTTAGFSTTDKIIGIEADSYGKIDTDGFMQGQRVNFDDITLTKYNTLSDNCINRSTSSAKKQCCIASTGTGSYYGDQLECPENKECWSSCMNSTTMSLKTFITQKADIQGKNKYNLVEDECYFVSDGDRIDLQDSCYLPSNGGIGKGYTACLTNASTCSGFAGINEYKANLSQFALKAPAMNGTYEFMMRIEYMPTWYNQSCSNETPEFCSPMVLYEKSTTFYVGRPACEPSWTCSDWAPQCTSTTGTQTRNCTDSACNLPPKTETRACCIESWSCGTWSECANNQRTRTCTDANNCSTSYTLNDTWQDPVCSIAACAEQDFNCTDWAPSICPESGAQSRICNLASTTCQDTGYRPDESQSCTYVPPEQPAISWLVWVIIIAVLVVAVIFLVWKVILPASKKGAKPGAETSPELTSYIRDAMATGASKQEISAKLQEAGWPKDAIDDAFKSTRY